MTLLATEYVSEIEKQTDFYLTRIRQIDKILAGPVKTLITLGVKGSSGHDDSKKLLDFPTWISDFSESDKTDNLLTQSICCATLQRLWRLRRRFAWLDSKLYERLKTLHGQLKNIFKTHPLNFDQGIKLLGSETFGGLNPLTASQVFRLLMEAGEDRTHAGLGFLAFFAIVWPLCRKFPDALTIGVRIEPWEVTAYGTAKCVIPIRILQKVINIRAQLLEDIEENLSNLETLASEDGARKRWEFNVELDELVANLRHLSKYSIDKIAFRNCAEEVEEKSGRQSDKQTIYGEVVGQIAAALLSLRETSDKVWKDANSMVGSIKLQILQPLEKINPATIPKTKNYEDLKRLDLRFSEEYLSDNDYWKDLFEAAEKACGYCDDALKVLDAARNICPGITTDSATNDSTVVRAALTKLATANRDVGKVMDEPVKDAARWCRKVVDREIAHASAENLTDFDPSELVSAIAVAVAWDLMTTNLQVSDAVKKAIAGARVDGSWRPGKPFYSPNYVYGIWTGTSDIVWSLASAIEHFPDVTEADEEIFNYVNWLERTQVTLTSTPPKPKRPPNEIANQRTSNRRDPREAPYVGWASERLRDRQKINLGTTAFSINALLEIRDLVEYRLWQLCKRRFSVVSIEKPLKRIDPVDLGAAHAKRLHRRLARIAHETQGPNYQTAEYSLLLHGPPGSSKTKMAEALSVEMWKASGRWGPSEARLLRITPADFTRLGEDRLDSEARLIFDLISGVRAVTIFFDEIDDLLRQRNTDQERPRFMDLVTPAMLNRLADLRSACPRQEICFLLATNYVENIDEALIRKGRIDDSIAVAYPDFESRMAIISSYRRKGEQNEVRELVAHCEQIARGTAGWPYLDIRSCCATIAETYSNVPASKPFKEVLEEAILESRRSRPEYDQRRRYTRELLNEYLHHIISCCERREECRKRGKRISKVITKLFPDVLQMLESILKKEERWQGRR